MTFPRIVITLQLFDLSMISAQTLVCREGKPVPTFPDHALVEDGKMISRTLRFSVLLIALSVGAAAPVLAQTCKRQGNDVTCDDGRRGIFANDAIVWADGSTSRLASPHPSVIIGNKSSVVIGPGVFAGNGKGGSVPMENPSAPTRARCPVVDGVAYCY